LIDKKDKLEKSLASEIKKCQELQKSLTIEKATKVEQTKE